MQRKWVDILERVGVTCVMVTAHDPGRSHDDGGAHCHRMNRGKFDLMASRRGDLRASDDPLQRRIYRIGKVIFEGFTESAREEDGLVIDAPVWFIR